jgi:hypothetical protein
MAKVRCNICANEVGRFCNIKKIKVKPNKARNCEAYIYDEAKIKTKQEIPTIRVGYRQQEENRRRMKAELKRLKEEMKKNPNQGTARDLGLMNPEEGGIIMPGDANFSMPHSDPKHPLTGDLSRFTTTAKDKE